MINMGALAEYSQLEMFLGTLLKDLRAKAVMKVELDPGDSSKLQYDKLQKHVLSKCPTADAPAIIDWAGARTALGIGPYSIPAGVLLPQMAVVLNLRAIPSEEALAPVQAMEEIPITKAEYTIDTKIASMMKAFEAWTIQLSTLNEPTYGGYQTASMYAIEADHPPPHTPMHLAPQNAPTGPPYYRLGPNYQQYAQHGLGPCIYCAELGHIRTFCLHVRTNQGTGIVHLTDCGRLTLGPRGGYGDEISHY